jgi:hypothetical protein
MILKLQMVIYTLQVALQKSISSFQSVGKENRSCTIDVSDLSDGIYLLRLNSNDRTVCKKVVVDR